MNNTTTEHYTHELFDPLVTALAEDAATNVHKIDRIVPPHDIARAIGGSVITTDFNRQPSQAASHDSVSDFYKSATDSEAERLQTMADMASDAVSLQEIIIATQAIKPGDNKNFGKSRRVVDIGCGDSPTLGQQLRREGYNYTGIDFRDDAKWRQQAGGNYAEVANALETRQSPGKADIVHYRAALSWISNADRKKALAECLRIGANDMSIVVIDFDWSVVEGPEPFVQSVNRVKDIMRAQGFDPEYGKHVHNDVKSKLEEALNVGGDSTDSTTNNPASVQSLGERRRPWFNANTLEEATGIITMTAAGISDQLLAVGMDKEARAITADLVKLVEYAKDNPHDFIRLPDIVSTSFNVKAGKAARLRAILLTQHILALRRGQDRARNPGVIIEGKDFKYLSAAFPMSNTVEAISPDLVRQCRLLQADSYKKDRIITDEAVDEKGLLVEENDPMDLVLRSRYFPTFVEGSRQLGASVRIITMKDGLSHTEQKMSLPTYARLIKHSPETVKNYANHPIFADPNIKLCEVSGVAKDFTGHGTVPHIVRSILGMAVAAQKDGFDYAVMGLRTNKVNFFKALFGTEACHVMKGSDSVHPVVLKGVRSDVEFIPLIVDAQRFLDLVYEHASAKFSAASENAKGGSHSLGPANIFAEIVNTIDAIREASGKKAS